MQNDPGGTRLDNVDRAIQVMQARRTRVLWYGASVLVALVSALMTRWAYQTTGLYIPLFSGLGLVFVVAGGAGPTAVATVGSLLLAHLLPPQGSMWPLADSERYRMYGNAVLLMIASVLSGLYRRSRLASLQQLARLELATREQQEVLESSTEAMLLTDASLRITYVNTQLEVLFGVARADAMGRDVREFLAPESLAERPLQVEALHTGETIRSERAALRADGTRIDLDISARFISGHRLLAVIRDATARKAIAEQQRAERDLLNGILATSIAGVGVVDMSGRIVFANQRAIDLLGLTRSGVHADGFDPVPFRQYALDGSPLPPEAQPYWRVVHERTPVNDVRLVLAWPDGHRLVMSVNGAPLLDGDGAVQGVVLAVNDITTAVSTEQALRQAQKMESIGRLAGSVAHDFNNLLTVILGEAELLSHVVPPGGEVAHGLASIRTAAASGSALTKQLLGFTRRQVVRVGLVDVNTLVQRVPPLVGRLLGVNVQLVLDLMTDPPLVRLDAAQFDQVLINLIVNARDAMPTGGSIHVRTRRLPALSPERRIFSMVGGGDLVEIRVEDTGHGMSDAVRQRVFEPFFTTKDAGSGTGLGLATSYGTVTQFGGTVTVESAVGSGTTFRILLPVAESPVAEAPVADEPTAAVDAPAPAVESSSSPAVALLEPANAVRQTEATVLVVDDEAAVRHVTASALRREGYRVLEADSGNEALRQLREHAGRIGVVVTDVLMPGMSGAALAEAIWKIVPAQRVLFVTGHEDGLTQSDALQRPGVALLWKPYATSDLTAQVRALLHGPAVPPLT